MARARIFDGSSTGKSQRIAALILGVSTWEDGQLQEHWNDLLPELDRMDLSGKTVAPFGLGDACGFSGEFVDALGTPYRKVAERGATVVGAWPTDGYDFEASSAIVDGRFVGLVSDEDNEADLSDERVAGWADTIRSALAEG